MAGTVVLLTSACGETDVTHGDNSATVGRAFGDSDDRLASGYPTAPLAAWTVSAGQLCSGENPELSVKAVAADALLTACHSSDRLVALDPATGTVKWQSDAQPGGYATFCSDTPVDGAFVCRIFAETDAYENYRAYRVSDGEVVASEYVEDLRQVAAHDGSLYAMGSTGHGSIGGWVSRGNLQDLRATWHTDQKECVGDEIYPDLEFGSEFMTTGYDVLNLETGAVVTPDDVFIQAVLPNGDFVAADCDDPSRVTILDSAGNRVRTHNDSSGNVHVAGDVYILEQKTEGEHIGYDATTGDEIWVVHGFEIERVVGDVIIGNDRETYVGRSPTDGRELWRWAAAPEDFPDTSSSLVEKNGLLIGFSNARNGEISAVDPETGQAIWTIPGAAGTTTTRPAAYAWKMGDGFVSGFGGNLTYYPPPQIK